MVTNLNNLPEMNDNLEFDESLFEVVGCSEENIEKLNTAPYSYWKSVWKQLMKNKVAILCLVIMAVLLFFTIFGPMIHRYDGVIFGLGGTRIVRPFTFFTSNLTGEQVFSVFGSDFTGRDLWTQIWTGSQFSLRLAVVVALINVVLGLIIGGLWGYIRALDPIMIEISNVISNVPTLLIYVMVMKILPNAPSPELEGTYIFWNCVLVMTMFGWLGLASTMRNQIIIIRNREFNIASECLGSSAGTIITHNLLPNLVSIIAQIVIDYIPACISSEVSLIFFGVLIFPAGQTSLGLILNNAYKMAHFQEVLTKYQHIMIFPSLIMILLTVSFLYFGMAVADATDPRKHR